MNEPKDMLSDADHNYLTEISAQKISAYCKYLHILEKWYEDINLEYPLHCRTNFRDSWFHYKKIYERNDKIKVLQEQYAMEEHLIRAIKDAIIHFFNECSCKLDCILNRIEKYKCLLKEEEKEEIKPYVDTLGWTPLHSEKWIEELKPKFEELYGDRFTLKELLKFYIMSAMYLYEEYFGIDAVYKEFCSYNDKIRNYCLSLRLHGTNIYRPTEDKEYLEECVNLYVSLVDCLKSLYLQTAWILFSDYCFDADMDKR